MTKLSVMISINRVNNKWIQSFQFYEGKLESYEGQYEHEDENDLTRNIIDEFETFYPGLSFLSEKIIEALNSSREQFLMDGRKNYYLAVEHDVSNDQLQNHMCCWKKIDKTVTRKYTRMNGVPNCDMKHHFKRFDNTSKSMEYFNNKKCPVCMASYKEILEDDQHVVIPQCGHPICCKCCDESLRNKPDCPLCREEMDIDKFDVMKFDINLQLVPQERRIYY